MTPKLKTKLIYIIARFVSKILIHFSNRHFTMCRRRGCLNVGGGDVVRRRLRSR